MYKVTHNKKKVYSGRRSECVMFVVANQIQNPNLIGKLKIAEIKRRKKVQK